MDKVLVLDAGGVLVTEPIAQFIEKVSSVSGISPEDLSEYYHSELYPNFWDGTMSKNLFWEKLLAYANLDTTHDGWEALLVREFQPLPAVNCLRQWRLECQLLVLLSNHRTDWLRPCLEKSGTLALFDIVLISEERKVAKPQPEAFADLLQEVSAHGFQAAQCLFVDDKESNLEAAQKWGIRGLLADDKGLWVEKVEAWLGQN